MSRGTPTPSGNALVGLFKSFLAKHQTTERFGIDKEMDGNWISEIAEDDMILPNLVSFACGIGNAAVPATPGRSSTMNSFEIMMEDIRDPGSLYTMRELMAQGSH